jgi:hypothetical protein
VLEEAEQRVARLEDSVRDLPRRAAPVVSLESSVRQYLDDLRSTVETNIEEARRLLARGVERIVLQRDEAGRLWAEMRGNLAGILKVDDGVLAGVGAGRGILSLPPWPPVAIPHGAVWQLIQGPAIIGATSAPFITIAGGGHNCFGRNLVKTNLMLRASIEQRQRSFEQSGGTRRRSTARRDAAYGVVCARHRLLYRSRELRSAHRRGLMGCCE